MAVPTNEIVDVLIIGSGASGAAVAWSLAETRMNILCLEQGNWMKQSDFPSNGRDWEARRYSDFDVSPNRRSAADRLSGQRRQLADEDRQLQRGRRRHDHVHGAFPADAPVGFSRAVAGRRRR
jgi:choline dehydrogenase-like flavoprotein